MIDSYMPLFYIAFWEINIVHLEAVITALFLNDEIRRVTMESIFPFITEYRVVQDMMA